MKAHRPLALSAAVLAIIAASAHAGVRLGVTVSNIEAIPGAHVGAVDPKAPGGATLKLKPGDLIRYVRVDEAGPLWRTPDVVSLISALRQTRRKVVVHYLRGGEWHRGTVRLIEKPEGGEPEVEGDEGKPSDDPREGAEEVDVPPPAAG